MKKITTTIFLLCVMCSAWADDEQKTSVIPLAVKINGVGDIYGAAVSVTGIGKRDMSFIAGGSGGDVQAAGLALNDIKVGKGTLGIALGSVNQADIVTQYGRGLFTLTPYKQRLQADVQVLSYQRPINTSERLSLSSSLMMSNVNIKSYQTLNNQPLVIGDNALGKITSTVLNTGIKWDGREENNAGMKSGSKANFGVSITSGRAAQSDQAQVDYGFSQHIELTEPWILSAYVKGGSAFIVRRETKYDELDEVEQAIKTQCDQGSASEQAACAQWKQEVAGFIQKSNTVGTAKALGGGAGLRSYSEQFFRSANYLLEGIETQYLLPFDATQKVKAQLVAFAEYGHSNDEFSKLTENNAYTVGGGVRAYVGDIPLRLEYAKGESDEVWYLTTGLIW